MSFIAGAGATNVDLLYEDMPKIPDVGEEIYTDKFSCQLGGGLPATLINIGRLGIESKIATELGGDMFSAFAAEQYKKNNVEPMNIYKGSSIPLNITSAIILKDDRSFITYGKGSIEPDDEAKESFYNMAHGAKICLMQPGGFIEVYKKLKSEGTLMVLDMGWDENMSVEKYSDLLDTADIYTPNRKEALRITGAANENDAADALKKYFDRVIVKVDKDGCIGIDNGERFFVKSVEKFKNKDSTGAGDAFLAGLCYGLFYDYPLEDCIEFGNIAGGKAVTAVGALSAYVTEKELLELKEENY
uniref:carbohydrate kinase family protein n=1 Tax=Eubacterium sp. TaxID=142586 RepID=UPI004028B957